MQTQNHTYTLNDGDNYTDVMCGWYEMLWWKWRLWWYSSESTKLTWDNNGSNGGANVDTNDDPLF